MLEEVLPGNLFYFLFHFCICYLLFLSSSGGIVLSAREGRIVCNNTLEQRLALASEGLLPEIRAILFGSANRQLV